MKNLKRFKELRTIIMSETQFSVSFSKKCTEFSITFNNETVIKIENIEQLQSFASFCISKDSSISNNLTFTKNQKEG